jgi:hypothetical protein
MLINLLISDFSKKVRVMTWLGVGAILLGMIGLAIALMGTFAGTAMGDFYGGVGAGLITFGVLVIIVYRLVLKDAARRKKAEIGSKDERNHFIILRAAGLTFFLVIFLLFGALLIVGPQNGIVFITLLWVLGALGGIFLLLLVILRRFL